LNTIKKRDFTLANVIDQYIASDKNILQGISVIKLEETYHQVVGELVSKYTEKVAYDNKTGKLTIFVKSAPLKAELKSLKSKLVENINNALGVVVVTEIYIK
jgi:hypothetical protein